MMDEPKERRILTEALARSGLTGRARKLFAKYPGIEAAARRCAGYLTAEIPGEGGRPLLDDCLERACVLGEAAEAAGGDPSAAFCAGLMELAHLALRRTVCAVWDDGAEGWDPFVEPLAAFLERHGQRRIDLLDEPSRDLPAHVARLALAARIVPAWLLRDVVREVVRAEAGGERLDASDGAGALV